MSGRSAVLDTAFCIRAGDFPVRDGSGPDPDGPLQREFHRIAQQVDEHGAQPLGVGHHPLQPIPDLYRDPRAILAARHGQGGLAAEAGKIHASEYEAWGPREVEHVPHDAVQP